MASTRVVTRGNNVYLLQSKFRLMMTPSDLTRLLDRVETVIEHLPEHNTAQAVRQGLLLGLVQSGKTAAVTATIAMAADNVYRCFVVVTSDINWLYRQTMERLKSDLQGIQVVEWKDDRTRHDATTPLPDRGASTGMHA